MIDGVKLVGDVEVDYAEEDHVKEDHVEVDHTEVKIVRSTERGAEG